LALIGLIRGTLERLKGCPFTWPTGLMKKDNPKAQKAVADRSKL